MKNLNYTITLIFTCFLIFSSGCGGDNSDDPVNSDPNKQSILDPNMAGWETIAFSEDIFSLNANYTTIPYELEVEEILFLNGKPNLLGSISFFSGSWGHAVFTVRGGSLVTNQIEKMTTSARVPSSSNSDPNIPKTMPSNISEQMDRHFTPYLKYFWINDIPYGWSKWFYETSRWRESHDAYVLASPTAHGDNAYGWINAPKAEIFPEEIADKTENLGLVRIVNSGAATMANKNGKNIIYYGAHIRANSQENDGKYYMTILEKDYGTETDTVDRAIVLPYNEAYQNDRTNYNPRVDVVGEKFLFTTINGDTKQLIGAFGNKETGFEYFLTVENVGVIMNIIHNNNTIFMDVITDQGFKMITIDKNTLSTQVYENSFGGSSMILFNNELLVAGFETFNNISGYPTIFKLTQNGFIPYSNNTSAFTSAPCKMIIGTDGSTLYACLTNCISPHYAAGSQFCGLELVKLIE